jgi:hypothetical protein
MAEPLQEGNYRVSVINQTTRCSSEELAILTHKADLDTLDRHHLHLAAHLVHRFPTRKSD